jgi:hypothetical protein
MNVYLLTKIYELNDSLTGNLRNFLYSDLSDAEGHISRYTIGNSSFLMKTISVEKYPEHPEHLENDQDMLIKKLLSKHNTASDFWHYDKNSTENMSNYGLKWFSLYYPTIRSKKTSKYIETIVSYSTFDCAHCAIKFATEWVKTNPVDREIYCTVTSVSKKFNNNLEIERRYKIPKEERIDDKIPSSVCHGVVSTSVSGCGNCGRVGHGAALCNYPSRSVLKVGVEVEGRYTPCNFATLESIFSGEVDGSIPNSLLDSDMIRHEFRTRPGTLSHCINQLAEIYPDEADNLCGLHVHFSFMNNLSISYLASEKFFSYLRARFNEWGKSLRLHPNSDFYKRLVGLNSYCFPNTKEDLLKDIYTYDRYRQVNFCSFSKFETVEFRLLPMFRDKELAVSAIYELYDIVETFLSEQKDIVCVVEDFELQSLQHISSNDEKEDTFFGVNTSTESFSAAGTRW